jgi:hypothetical protein
MMDDDKSFFGRLKQWFAPDKTAQQSDDQVDADKEGFFFYVACDNCGNHLRLRVTRSYDLERGEGGGFSWRKTIVDSRCFRKMEAMVLFDSAYRVVEKEIEGGRFVGRAEWEENR